MTAICRHRSNIFSQLNVPVSEIDEMLPAIVLVQAEVDLNKWTPLRSLRFANQMHSGLLRRAIGFEGIALDARADDVFPRRWPTAVARNHVIEIQIIAIKRLTAILAHVLVAFENIVAREFDFLFRHPIEHHQQDDARNANAKRDGLDGFRMGFTR